MVSDGPSSEDFYRNAERLRGILVAQTKGREQGESYDPYAPSDPPEDERVTVPVAERLAAFVWPWGASLFVWMVCTVVAGVAILAPQPHAAMLSAVASVAAVIHCGVAVAAASDVNGDIARLKRKKSVALTAAKERCAVYVLHAAALIVWYAVGALTLITQAVLS